MGDGRPVQFLFPDQSGQLLSVCAELPNHLVVMLDPLFIPVHIETSKPFTSTRVNEMGDQPVNIENEIAHSKF